MELIVHYKELPQGMDLDRMRAELADVLEEDGWVVGSGGGPAGGYVELELEDERANPKYGILAVGAYLRRAAFPAGTAIELAGVRSDLYG